VWLEYSVLELFTMKEGRKELGGGGVKIQTVFFTVDALASRDKWVFVTTAWRVLRLRMEERSPKWRMTSNILNKQSRTADKGWYSSLGVGARC